jgi:predicted nucleic-acid-binding Zn-ribbon protein
MRLRTLALQTFESLYHFEEENIQDFEEENIQDIKENKTDAPVYHSCCGYGPFYSAASDEPIE